MDVNRFKIGSRTLKTGIAVTLAIGIARALQIEPAIFAAVSAIVNLQPTVYQSYINAIQQVAITAIGIVVGLIFGLLLGNMAITVGIASIVVILIALRLRLNSVILVGIVSVIFIVDTQKEFFIEHAFARISVIFVGLIVALLVNIILSPSDYRKFTLEKVSRFHMNVANLFHTIICDFINKTEPSDEEYKKLHALLEESESLGDSIDIYKQEIRVMPFSIQAKDLHERAHLLEDIHRFDVQLLNKLSLLGDLEKSRLDRLADRKSIPYSVEFQLIINTIHEVNERFRENASILNDRILGKQSSSAWHEIEDLDESFNEKISAWQKEHTTDNSYYFRALMELSVIVYELRWITREQHRLYNRYTDSLHQNI